MCRKSLYFLSLSALRSRPLSLGETNSIVMSADVIKSPHVPAASFRTRPRQLRAQSRVPRNSRLQEMSWCPLTEKLDPTGMQGPRDVPPKYPLCTLRCTFRLDFLVPATAARSPLHHHHPSLCVCFATIQTRETVRREVASPGRRRLVWVSRSRSRPVGLGLLPRLSLMACEVGGPLFVPLQCLLFTF